MTSNSLFSNDNYDVVIGISADPSYKSDVYLVVNNTTGITEAETPILPQAMIFAEDFSTSLANIEAKREEGDKVTPIFQH